MSTLSKYIGDTDIIARFRVQQLRVAVLVILTFNTTVEKRVWDTFQALTSRPVPEVVSEVVAMELSVTDNVIF